MLGTRARLVRPITASRYRVDHGIRERRRPRSIWERTENPEGEGNVELNVDGLAGRHRVFATRTVAVQELPQGVVRVSAYALELGLEIVRVKLVLLHQLVGA